MKSGHVQSCQKVGIISVNQYLKEQRGKNELFQISLFLLLNSSYLCNRSTQLTIATIEIISFGSSSGIR